jgi:hypothetical protein
MGVIAGQGTGFPAAGAAAEVATPAVSSRRRRSRPGSASVLTFRWRQVSPPGGRHATGRRPGPAGWLAFTHRLPWRPMSFLADAHQRGVLRQAGAVYQFRHIELQHRLANRDANDQQASSSAAAATKAGE